MKAAPRGAAEPQDQVHGGRHTTGDQGSSQRLPVGTKASASDWTIMQSLRILTLRLTMAYRGSGNVWKTAVRELTDGVDDIAYFYAI